MTFLQNRETKRFYFCTAAFSAALILFCGLLAMQYAVQAKDLLLDRESAFVSSLLEQRVPAETIAQALKCGQTTAEGAALLEKLGHTGRIPLHLLAPEESGFRFCAGAAVVGAGLLGAGLLAATAWFLNRREETYRQAAEAIADIPNGGLGLPQNETGALCQLFDQVRELASALGAKAETEQRSREFLKDTISDISHQLKTPLAALSMYVQILSDQPEDAEAVRRFAEKCASSVDRMERLIYSLLKVTRLDAGAVTMDARLCSVGELVDGAVVDLRTRARQEEKRILLQGNLEETLLCDPEWTSEALGNLVKNALDYTQPGGCVRISWERSASMLRLSVADDGCGIPEKELYHIFKRFYRRPGSQGGGIGLGLPLAKKIVEEQGGLITVESIPGKGTTFTVCFLTEM